MQDTTPAKGRILISEPFLMDPNFKRSTILLTEHNEEGSIGFVLNRPSAAYVHEMVENFPDFDSKVYIGGPVQLNILQFIHKAGDLIDGGIEISDGLWWGGSFETVKRLVEEKRLSSDDIRFFMGYSGWADGQLENEMDLNSWLVTTPTLKEIFSGDTESLWKNALKSTGSKFSIFGDFPDNPSLN